MIKASGIRVIVLFLAGLAGWGGYNALAIWNISRPLAGPAVLTRQNHPANRAVVDSALRLLKSGDLALRTGADVTSYMLRQMNLKDKAYSHCGIVMVEDGYPFVYHCIGGEDNPDSRLRRDSAALFFSPVSNERLGIARLDLRPAQVRQLQQIVRRYYAAAPPFDMDFDLATDDRLYCAEFVYKAIREAARDTAYFGTTRVLDRHYVGVDDLTNRRHAALMCDVRYKP
jgi:hypothetical protein